MNAWRGFSSGFSASLDTLAHSWPLFSDVSRHGTGTRHMYDAQQKFPRLSLDEHVRGATTIVVQYAHTSIPQMVCLIDSETM